ncbi:hypothetical protein BDV29DRAFT_43409 [Aspergillus leporis]|uniref:Uncharacterized protein n=1 Tax=Aspergillus leporis TaxID=41062 RepID=A0A5N5WNS0_9EURO|nr:hypothetical protein BDV29DRAFT_43409 [Aspergillus leporis]
MNVTESPSPNPAAPLTHMTKKRARGPKRRLPNPVVSEAVVLASKGATESREILPSPGIEEPEALDFVAKEEPSFPEVAPTVESEQKEADMNISVSGQEAATREGSLSPYTEEIKVPITESTLKEEHSFYEEVPRSFDVNVKEAHIENLSPKGKTASLEVLSPDVEGKGTSVTDSTSEEEPLFQKPLRSFVVQEKESPISDSVPKQETISRERTLSSDIEEINSVGPTSNRETISSRISLFSDTKESEVMDSSSKEKTDFQQISLHPDLKEPEISITSPVSKEEIGFLEILPSSSFKEPEVSKMDPVPKANTDSQEILPSFSFKGPEASSSLSQSPAGNSSGWPLPDVDTPAPVPFETGLTQPDPSTTSKPTEFKRSIPHIAERDSKEFGTVRSKAATKFEKLTQKFERAHEDPDSRRESFKPVPPPKAAPSTPTPDFRQSRGSPVHFSSPSPSPLRSSFKQNQAYPSPTSYRKAAPSLSPTTPRNKSLPSPPVPPKSSPSVDQFSPRSSASLVPQADESLDAISSFFKTFPNSSDRVNIDAQLMLTSKNDNQKIRTLRMQMWEITGDGKKQDLPLNQEYILYEGSMYLCVHTFETDGGVRSETHLWCGDDVPDAAIDDAQSFSKRVAKDNGCKLEIVKQGKEAARFIQALGGILITRRGLSSRSSSSAFFMLCGRKHLGQMVFDEVNFSRHSLCSGYPFVISAMFGKVYLWKGKGSAAEEVGAARLIGMDLGLTGEFEEVAEGEEPESFFECFPQHGESGDYMRPDYWRRKPNHECYRPRLLRIDHELGQRSTGFWLRRSGAASPVIRPNDTVQEIEPFCQKDIKANGIYILDTFFEIYVIVGEQATNRPAEFVSAVFFAHEYGILAASLQDRPFIPNSFVSLGGVPDTSREAFRKWEQPFSPMPPQVFPLNAAIEAVRS